MTIYGKKSGWTETEKTALMDAVRMAEESGASLRSVFEKTGDQLGRKPNSVRNYYYLQLRGEVPDNLRRAAPFVTFTEAEVEELVRQVILAKSRGQSVRACVMEMSGGDKTAMLRYQNKYRSVLRKKPELICGICEKLAKEGVNCKNPLEEQRREESTALENNRKLLQTVDRMKVQTDLMRLQLEDMQAAARAILLLCKDFLGLLPEERQGNLTPFCRELTERLAVLENAAN